MYKLFGWYFFSVGCSGKVSYHISQTMSSHFTLYLFQMHKVSTGVNATNLCMGFNGYHISDYLLWCSLRCCQSIVFGKPRVSYTYAWHTQSTCVYPQFCKIFNTRTFLRCFSYICTLEKKASSKDDFAFFWFCHVSIV